MSNKDLPVKITTNADEWVALHSTFSDTNPLALQQIKAAMNTLPE